MFLSLVSTSDWRHEALLRPWESEKECGRQLQARILSGPTSQKESEGNCIHTAPSVPAASDNLGPGLIPGTVVSAC